MGRQPNARRRLGILRSGRRRLTNVVTWAGEGQAINDTTSDPPSAPSGLSRRSLLIGAAAIGGATIAGGAGLLRARPMQAPVVGPRSPVVAAAEAARPQRAHGEPYAAVSNRRYVFGVPTRDPLE